MKASDYLKEFERKQGKDEGKKADKEHSLQENARERAEHPDDLRAGTAFDWQEVDSYKAELDRMKRGEGKQYSSRKERDGEASPKASAPDDDDSTGN